MSDDLVTRSRFPLQIPHVDGNDPLPLKLISKPYLEENPCQKDRSVKDRIEKGRSPSGKHPPFMEIQSMAASVAAAAFAISFLVGTSPCSCQNDNLTPGSSISASQTLVSSGGFFALGFFPPPSNSTTTVNHYVGIWYNNISERTIVWVANRDSPVSSSGVMKLFNDGNLAVLEGRTPIWSTGILSNTTATRLTLRDTGNLVVTGGGGVGDVLWQSFDHPTDTLLPYMKLSISLTPGASPRRLVSWKSPSDPSTGNASLSLDPNSPLQLLLRNGSDVEWRYGIWGEKKVNFIPGINSNALHIEAMVIEDREIHYTFSMTDSLVLLRVHVEPSGELRFSAWSREESKWIPEVIVPYAPSCEVYNKCGPFGTCDDDGGSGGKRFACKCLNGFLPTSQEEWDAGNFASGCVRVTPLNCTSTGGKGQHRFVKFTGIRLPDEFLFFSNKSAVECEAMCASNCSCSAYAYSNSSNWDVVDIRCLVWYGELKDMVLDSRHGGELFVRFADHLGYDAKKGRSSKRNRLLLLIILPNAFGLLLLVAIGCFLRKRLSIKGSGTTRTIEVTDDQKDGGTSALLLLDFESLTAATNKFSPENKLGEGGFGPVYKAKLSNGQEVAVKRLSDQFGQGTQEFKNEIELIGKLQHKNLVRLLSWCTYADEKILIYEYLPNRSLDKFLFDPSLSPQLNWSLRYQIIEGIAQGLLYLHRFSRLRIIHRDLKTSNILLDAEMNPKISDFGLARIFGGSQIEAKTRRVVGTYGYMSPEYAMRGFFSEKSDVFSFGVIVLEIITGKRNSGNDPNNDSFYLLEYAWKLWEEGRSLELMDSSMENSTAAAVVEKCVQMGLLCVQEVVSDRPTISSVLSMLNNEKENLPRPKKPAFSVERHVKPYQLSSDTSKECSNDLSFSITEGR